MERAQLVQMWRDWVQDPVNREAVLRMVEAINGDGHTLFAVDAFPELPEFAFPLFVQTHHSGSEPKEMIFANGEVVETLQAIYGLTLAEAIADALDAPLLSMTPLLSMMGRGFRSRDACDAVRRILTS